MKDELLVVLRMREHDSLVLTTTNIVLGPMYLSCIARTSLLFSTTMTCALKVSTCALSESRSKI